MGAHDLGGLLRWMRLHPAELPPGIKRHIDYEEGQLSSTATVVGRERSVELYLMARPATKELHVVLVDGQTTYYLIDRSFQKDGRLFRHGRARRRDDLIIGVVSEDRAPSSPEATLFYDIFLRWWEAERLRL